MENKKNDFKKHYYARKYLYVIFGIITSAFLSNRRYSSSDIFLIMFLFAIVMMFIRYNTAYVTIGNDYIKINIVIFIKVLYIQFNEIINYNYDQKKIEIYYKCSYSGEEKKGIIYTNQFGENEKESLLQELNKICNEKKQKNNI